MPDHQGPGISDHKQATLQVVTKIFLWACGLGFVIVAVGILLGLVIPLFFDPAAKMLAAKLTNVSTCLLIGAFEMVLGILLALIGITADYDIDATIGGAKMKIVSASPGLILILCGNLLIAFALSRQFEVTQYSQESSSGERPTNEGPHSPAPADQYIAPLEADGP